mgnify:CR=1 FL=1
MMASPVVVCCLATLRDLFRFLLVFRLARLDYLLSFFRFFFWKKLCEAKRSKPQQEAGNEKSERNKM